MSATLNTCATADQLRELTGNELDAVAGGDVNLHIGPVGIWAASGIGFGIGVKGVAFISVGPNGAELGLGKWSGGI